MSTAGIELAGAGAVAMQTTAEMPLQIEFSIEEEWTGRLARYFSLLARDLHAALPHVPNELIVHLEYLLRCDVARVFAERGVDLVLGETTFADGTARFHATIDLETIYSDLAATAFKHLVGRYSSTSPGPARSS